MAEADEEEEDEEEADAKKKKKAAAKPRGRPAKAKEPKEKAPAKGTNQPFKMDNDRHPVTRLQSPCFRYLHQVGFQSTPIPQIPYSTPACNTFGFILNVFTKFRKADPGQIQPTASTSHMSNLASI